MTETLKLTEENFAESIKKIADNDPQITEIIFNLSYSFFGKFKESEESEEFEESEESEKFFAALSQNHIIESLVFANNAYNYLPDKLATRLLKASTQNINLKKLDLESNEINQGKEGEGAEAVKALAEFLAQNKELLVKYSFEEYDATKTTETKDIKELFNEGKLEEEHENGFTPGNYKYIALSVRGKKKLWPLSNNLSDDGKISAQELQELYLINNTQNTTLEELNLRGNHLEPQDAIEIAKALKQNTTLKTLNLEDNKIDDEGAAAIAEALAQNTTLETLNLGNNEIGEKGAAAIAEALAQNTTLKTLILEGNTIDVKGAEKIAEALAQNTALKTLNLEDNGIGEKGAAAIAEALAQNTTLKTLNLANNGIGGEGGTKIAKALAQNTALTTLNLGYNAINRAGYETFKALAKALTKNTTLKTLILEKTNLGIMAAKEIAEALAQNTTLETLNLEYNEIGDKGAKELAEVLTKDWEDNYNGAVANQPSQKAEPLNQEASPHREVVKKGDLQQRHNHKYHFQEPDTQKATETLDIKSFFDDDGEIKEFFDDDGEIKEEFKYIKYLKLLVKGEEKLVSFSLWGYIDGKLVPNFLGQDNFKRLYVIHKSSGRSSGIKNLFLGHNRIGSEGTKFLAVALSKNATLKNLDLKYNRKLSEADTEGGKALAKALEENMTLRWLGLECNLTVDQISCNHIRQYLKRNNNFAELKIILNASTDQESPNWEEICRLQKLILEKLGSIIAQDPETIQDGFIEKEFCSLLQDTCSEVTALACGQVQTAIIKPQIADFIVLLKNYFNDSNSQQAPEVLKDLKCAIKSMVPDRRLLQDYMQTETTSSKRKLGKEDDMFARPSLTPASAEAAFFTPDAKKRRL
jgi:Ran GTPase-activating protein (RanGAP) involved in mRNA processing and transport